MRLLFVCLAMLAVSLPAQARQRHGVPVRCVETGSVMVPVCGMGEVAYAVKADEPVPNLVTKLKLARGLNDTKLADGIRPNTGRGLGRDSAGAVIGGRPAGCPSRYCGCGASIHLFGRIIPALNLAANWLRFPRAAPAPKMAATRRGHVMVLEEHVAGNVWMVFDANSGHGATRLHARSIAGFAIVDPNGAG